MSDDSEPVVEDHEPKAVWTNPTVLAIAVAWLASMVLAIGFIVFLARGNVDLSRRLDAAENRSVCLTAQRTAEAQAFFDDKIAYNDYVLALGGRGDIVAAQAAIEASTANLRAVQAAGRDIEETCGS